MSRTVARHFHRKKTGTFDRKRHPPPPQPELAQCSAPPFRAFSAELAGSLIGSLETVAVRTFFCIPLIIFALLFSLPSHNSDLGSHNNSLLSSFPTTIRALSFYREKTSVLSSFVDSHRIVPTCAINRPPQQLIYFIYFLQINSNLTTVEFEVQEQQYKNSSIRG